MDAPKTLTEALAALRETAAKNDTLTADLVAAQSLLAEAEQGRQQAANALDAANLERAQLLAERIAMDHELTNLRQAAKSTEAKVTEAVAALGVPPVALATEQVTSKTKAELWAEYRKLPIEARYDFYRANESAMKD